MPLESLLRTVQDCEAMCEQTLTAVAGCPMWKCGQCSSAYYVIAQIFVG
jgi:hypothetical protein